MANDKDRIAQQRLADCLWDPLRDRLMTVQPSRCTRHLIGATGAARAFGLHHGARDGVIRPTSATKKPTPTVRWTLCQFIARDGGYTGSRCPNAFAFGAMNAVLALRANLNTRETQNVDVIKKPPNGQRRLL